MKTVPTLRILFLLCALLTLSSAAQAQNRYTFVSMTGSDANDCLSATTACRTFQRAHDAVSDGGTVLARDSGAYGAINITKSVTISGEGVLAGITVTGASVTGVNINAAGVVVRLRYLNITGINTSGLSYGVGYLTGAAVHVEHCTISGFSTAGLHTNSPGRFYVSDSTSRGNTYGLLVGGGAGVAAPPFGQITVERTELEQNSAFGLTAGGGKTTIRQSRIAGNTLFGIDAFNAGVEVTVDDCNISHNGTGIDSSDNAIVRVANSTIANNATGLTSTAGGQILSREESSGGPRTNTLEGNTTAGAFTGTYTAQ